MVELQPLRWSLPLAGSLEEGRLHEHLRRHHYLGLRVVGENLKYLVQTRDGQDVACLLFGAAAWQSAARDQFIGWTAAQRAQGLSQVVNNTRFLILPWVKVPGLASHVLSRAVRRLSGGLATQIRPPGLAGGNVRGPGPFCGHGLSGGQLAADWTNAGARAAGTGPAGAQHLD